MKHKPFSLQTSGDPCWAKFEIDGHTSPAGVNPQTICGLALGHAGGHAGPCPICDPATTISIRRWSNGGRDWWRNQHGIKTPRKPKS